MNSGEISLNGVDAELANLLADVEAYMAIAGADAALSEAQAPASESTTPVEAPAPEAFANDDGAAEAPAEDMAVPDFGLDSAILSVGQSLAGSEFVFIF
jgi:hypothetical protein